MNNLCHKILYIERMDKLKYFFLAKLLKFGLTIWANHLGIIFKFVKHAII
jgi:hypothetical protein